MIGSPPVDIIVKRNFGIVAGSWNLYYTERLIEHELVRLFQRNETRWRTPLSDI